MAVRHATPNLARFNRPQLMIPVTAILLLGMIGDRVQAAACNVPGSHTTIQAAVDDAGCDTVTIGIDAFSESVMIARSLDLSGAGVGMTIVNGSFTVLGASTLVSLDSLTINSGCERPALSVTGGAKVDSIDVVASPAAIGNCPINAIIFSDSFE